MALTQILIAHETEQGEKVEVPGRISIENGAIFIRIDVPKEDATFPDRSKAIEKLAKDCEANGIEHELLFVGRLKLPDCIKIFCK
ncbi:MAG: hypothetical protein WCV85_01760 [Patescibacteria group bacterium]|jgi:hypothetical protein